MKLGEIFDFRAWTSDVRSILHQNKSAGGTIEWNCFYVIDESVSAMFYATKVFGQLWYLLHHRYGNWFIWFAIFNVVNFVRNSFLSLDIFGSLMKCLPFSSLSKGFHLKQIIHVDIWLPSFSNTSYLAMKISSLHVHWPLALGHFGLPFLWPKKFNAFFA